MADEPSAVSTEEAKPPTQAEAQAESADQQPEPIDWDALEATIEKAYTSDPKTATDRLKRHRAIGGIAGNLAEQRYARLEAERDAERQAEAARKAAADLEDMARNRPLEFADRFLSEKEAADARNRILSVERNTAKQMMEQIGKAYHGVPEWADLSDDEKGKLAAAVKDAPDDDVLPRFNRAALDIVAERRAAKRIAAQLEKEKSSWRKEWEAERLTREGGPDLRSPSSVANRRVNWSAMSDEDFDKYWKSRYG